MSRAYRCDGPCGQHIARDGDVTILKAHTLGRDDQSPWLGVKVKGRTIARVMGINHYMTRAELAQAIPPVYTTYVGLQLMMALDHAEVRA